MAGSEDDPTIFQTSSEESQRQAEAAFGEAGASGPIGVPGGDDARRRAFRRVVVAFVVLAVIVGVAIGGYLVVKSAVEDDEPSEPSFTTPAVPAVPSPPKTSSTATPKQPAAPSDNFSAAGLRRAKAKAQDLAGPGARIQLARVTRDQLQVIARNGSGGKVVIVSPALTRAIDTASGALTGNEFGFEAFNPAAAARLTRAIDRRYHVPAGQIDYMVVIRDPIEKNVEWLVYPRSGGGHFQADSSGGSLRRVG
jgi:pyruvate/2-oxoglutarate dehydrogenase complex dihydrolipoamide acyltransferase (E2) component